MGFDPLTRQVEHFRQRAEEAEGAAYAAKWDCSEARTERDALKAEVERLTAEHSAMAEIWAKGSAEAVAEIERLRAALENVRHIADVAGGDRDPPNFDPRDHEAQEECATEHPMLYICYLASTALNPDSTEGE